MIARIHEYLLLQVFMYTSHSHIKLIVWFCLLVIGKIILGTNWTTISAGPKIAIWTLITRIYRCAFFCSARVIRQSIWFYQTLISTVTHPPLRVTPVIYRRRSSFIKLANVWVQFNA